MFPTANSQVFYNEDGEVLGFDTYREDDAPYYDESVNLYGYDDYDEDIDPDECEHSDVNRVTLVGPDTYEGTCDWCESPVQFSGEGDTYKAVAITDVIGSVHPADTL